MAKIGKEESVNQGKPRPTQGCWTCDEKRVLSKILKN